MIFRMMIFDARRDGTAVVEVDQQQGQRRRCPGLRRAGITGGSERRWRNAAVSVPAQTAAFGHHPRSTQ